MTIDPRKKIQNFIFSSLKARLDHGVPILPTDIPDLAEKVADSLIYLRFLPFALQMMENNQAQEDQQSIDLIDLSKMVADEIHVALSEYYSPSISQWSAFYPQQITTVPYN